jgi:hypothetical protein
MIILEHNFKTKAHDLISLFQGVKKFSTFITRIEQQSIIDPLRYEPQKYLGDAFEFFVELFLKLHPTDNRVGVYKYHPVQENDNGVDGVGLNIKLEKCVVQIKYRTDNMSVLTANQDHLSNMFSDGMLAHNVVADMVNTTNYRHFVFTTANGLHFYTDQEMFKLKVKCIGYTDFRTMLDNNLVFWKTALETVEYITMNAKLGIE